MAEKNGNKVTLAAGKAMTDKGNAPFKHVEVATLERWLTVLVDDKTDANERVGWLKMAIAWTLGKNNKLANHVMTRQFGEYGNVE